VDIFPSFAILSKNLMNGIQIDLDKAYFIVTTSC
jgi:hypothetical protein